MLLLYAYSQGQTSCNDAYPDLNYAYSHVKSAYNSNNISHLKFYSNKSVKAFERVKLILNNCNCEEVYNNVYDGYDLLSKVADAESYEDGRFYVSRGRKKAKQSIIELDKCTELSNNDENLEALQDEQLKLKQQQLELKEKEKELKRKLAEQKQKELIIKKEILINSFEAAISSKIKNFNEILKICECNSEVINKNSFYNELVSKNINDIKIYYLNNVKEITSNYLAKLDVCNN